MNEPTPVDKLKAESSKRGKDPSTRRILIILVVLWILTLFALIGVSWNAYFQQKDAAQTLAQQIALACETGDFGSEFSKEDEEALCSNAEKVIENDPELQDEEIQEREIQEREIQEQEIQERENQDKEDQNPEDQEREKQDSEAQDEETQDAEDQESEIQDDETQDPEIDDPDPNDPDPADDDVTGGSCTFDGWGTITFTLQTDSGEVKFTCTGTMTPPGQE